MVYDCALYLSYNTYGLPVLTKDTKCPNQVFYVCAKYGLETSFSPNDDIRKYSLEM
jgi:hypothetical protein